eukprot:8281027-Lingulodinium_polyedra.AAC.1
MGPRLPAATKKNKNAITQRGAGQWRGQAQTPAATGAQRRALPLDGRTPRGPRCATTATSQNRALNGHGNVPA